MPNDDGMVILYAILTYLALGFLFGLWFIFRLIDKLDEGVVGSPWSFKLIILPGCIVFWPTLLKKYLRLSRKHHRD